MIIANAITNDKNISLEIYGHADYAEHGKDIVCAGVSVLSQSYANALIKNELVQKIIMEDGYLYVMAVKTPESELLFDMTISGIESIKEQFKQNICVNYS